MTLRWWSGITGLAGGSGVALATLLSVLADRAWLFDLLANFRVQYLWIGVLAGVALAVNRLRIPFAIVGLALLVNLVAVAPYWLGSIAEPVGEERLDILHLNTQAGNPAKSEVVDFVRNADADLVFLAEVTPVLAELLAAADLPFDVIAATPGTTPMGLVALARDGIATGRLTNLGVSEIPAMLVQARLGTRPIEILAFHASSPGEERRSANRDDQLAAAGALVSGRSTPMILVGDFNATPWTPALRRLLDAGLVDAQRGRGVAGSWPAGWGPLMIAIDHLLHTPELTTTAYTYGDSVGSDHRSLHVTIAPAAVASS
jgi:endonuclease/exonuclease/phosphatase (EEP) superfamily protein YafD